MMINFLSRCNGKAECANVPSKVNSAKHTHGLQSRTSSLHLHTARTEQVWCLKVKVPCCANLPDIPRLKNPDSAPPVRVFRACPHNSQDKKPHRWRAINAFAQHRKGFPDISEATTVSNSASMPLVNTRNKFYNFGGSMQQQATGQHHCTPTADFFCHYHSSATADSPEPVRRYSSPRAGSRG